MANRMISYGYGYEKGGIAVLSQEAEIVRWIFTAYIEGKLLREIAEKLQTRKVEFFNGDCTWNKNRVNRIIENRKYVGETMGYSAIIPLETFEKANALKNDKGHKQQKQSAEILYLKKVSFCGECGRVLTRNPKWATREKWVCKNGCKCRRYMDDKAIFSAIKKAILSVEGNKSTQPPQAIYKRTQEILRHTNEIARLTSTQNPSFAVGKKLIFECVNLKFQACKEDKSIYRNTVLRLAEDFCVECIPKIVSKIFIYGNGNIKVSFKDGQEYMEEVENAS